MSAGPRRGCRTRRGRPNLGAAISPARPVPARPPPQVFTYAALAQQLAPLPDEVSARLERLPGARCGADPLRLPGGAPGWGGEALCSRRTTRRTRPGPARRPHFRTALQLRDASCVPASRRLLLARSTPHQIPPRRARLPACSLAVPPTSPAGAAASNASTLAPPLPLACPRAALYIVTTLPNIRTQAQYIAAQAAYMRAVLRLMPPGVRHMHMHAPLARRPAPQPRQTAGSCRLPRATSKHRGVIAGGMPALVDAAPRPTELARPPPLPRRLHCGAGGPGA